MILETYYSYIDDANVYCRQQQKVDFLSDHSQTFTLRGQDMSVTCFFFFGGF